MKKTLPDQGNRMHENSSCPYFKDGRISTIEYIIPCRKDVEDFHKYLAKGYRRIGRIFYRNTCEQCADCLPLRIEAEKFIPSKSQRRVIRNNNDIRLDVLDRSTLTVEKALLYHRYIQSKHGGKTGEDPIDALNVLQSIHYGYPGTIEIDYYLGDKLIGVGIVDEGKDALSSNYFYYDTDYLQRRPGVFSVLKEIELAQRLAKKYFYLGFCIEDNAKMSYKKFFRPNEIYEKDRWVEFLTS